LTSKLNKLCSVIITTYNRENLIVETLNSVYNQTYRPIELIIIEDGSTDNTAIVINDWIKGINHRNFNIIFRVQENKGAPKARNLALSLCSGDYIQEVGSDDLLHSSKFELQITALEGNVSAQSAWNPLLRFNQGDVIDISNSLLNEFKTHSIGVNAFDNQLQFFPSAALHRAEVFKNTGAWDEGLKRWQDLIYQVRMTSNVKNVLVYNSPMYFFRQHNFGRINDQYRNYEGVENGIEALKLLEKYLNQSQKRNYGTRREIFYLYYSLIQTSLKNKDNKALNLLTLNLMIWSPNLKLKIKAIVLHLIVITKLQNYFIGFIVKK